MVCTGSINPSGFGVEIMKAETRRRLKIVLRRSLAIVIGLVVFVISLIYDFLGTQTLAVFVFIHSSMSSADNYPTVAGWRFLFGIFEYGYPVAVALTTSYAFWDGFPKERKRLLFFILLFGAIGPLTFINYIQSDQLVDRKVQVLFNLVTIFISYVLVLNIQALNPTSKDGLALQSLSIWLLTSLGIMLPMFYTIVFGLVIFGLMSLKTAQGLGDQTAIGISGAIGAVIATLNALKSLRNA